MVVMDERADEGGVKGRMGIGFKTVRPAMSCVVSRREASVYGEKRESTTREREGCNRRKQVYSTGRAQRDTLRWGVLQPVSPRRYKGICGSLLILSGPDKLGENKRVSSRAMMLQLNLS